MRGGEVRVQTRKVEIRLPGKGNSDSHGARPVHKITSIMKWIRTSRLSTNYSRIGFKVKSSGLSVGAEKMVICLGFGVTETVDCTADGPPLANL